MLWLLDSLKQGQSASVNLFITSTLVFDIFGYHFFVSILTDGVYVIPARPELPSPEHFLNFWVPFENLLGSYAFRGLDDSTR